MRKQLLELQSYGTTHLNIRNVNCAPTVERQLELLNKETKPFLEMETFDRVTLIPEIIEESTNTVIQFETLDIPDDGEYGNWLKSNWKHTMHYLAYARKVFNMLCAPSI